MGRELRIRYMAKPLGYIRIKITKGEKMKIEIVYLFPALVTGFQAARIYYTFTGKFK